MEQFITDIKKVTLYTYKANDGDKIELFNIDEILIDTDNKIIEGYYEENHILNLKVIDFIDYEFEEHWKKDDSWWTIYTESFLIEVDIKG